MIKSGARNVYLEQNKMYVTEGEFFKTMQTLKHHFLGHKENTSMNPKDVDKFADMGRSKTYLFLQSTRMHTSDSPTPPRCKHLMTLW